MKQLLLPMFKLFVSICVFDILCDHLIINANPISKKIMKGKLHRGKRDVDILAECDLQCLSDDEIKDYELLIEYDYGPEVESPNNFYSGDHNKKCSYACKILDMEKTDENTGTGLPGEYSISFEDDILSNFRPNVEESTSSSTSTLPSTPTTFSTSIISTTADVKKPNESADELLKQCLDLFAAFGTQTPQNSAEHPCAYFEKKVATTEATTSSTTTSSPPLSTTESTTTNEISSSTPSSSPTVSTESDPLPSTSYTPSNVLSGDFNTSLENSSGPDTKQDIALRMLPVDRRISPDRYQAPKRVIPKIIRYTIVEAEMVEEGSDGNSDPAEIVQVYQIDPEIIKSVDSSMSHISSGLASIKNMSKSIPYKHQYESRKPKPTVKSTTDELTDPIEIELDEDFPENDDEPELPADLHVDMKMAAQLPTSTTESSRMNSTEEPVSSTTNRVSLVSETTSLRPVDPTTVIDRKPNLLYDAPFDAPFIPYNPDIPAAHFTRNTTKTFITSQNVTSVQTNQTFEIYAYALMKDDDSTTSTSRTMGENHLLAAADDGQSRHMADFAARTSNTSEVPQRIFKESNIDDKVSEPSLALEEQNKVTTNGVTQSPASRTLNNTHEVPQSSFKESNIHKVTQPPLSLDEQKKATTNEVTQSPAARTLNTSEVPQSSFNESNIDKVTQSHLALEEQIKATTNEVTQSPAEERKVEAGEKNTELAIEERKRAVEDKIMQSPLDERNETELMAYTTENALKSLPTEAKNLVSAVKVTEENFRESVLGALETTSSNPSVTEPFSELNSTTMALEEFYSSSNETTTDMPIDTNFTNASKDQTGQNLSSPSSETDFTFSGKFSAKDNSSYPAHFKNTLIENLKRLDHNASVDIAPGKVGENSTEKPKKP